MKILTKEITVKHVLTHSKLPGIEYSVNPYVGCCHACVYCYARFMRRFTNHDEDWGTFVDIKINAAETVAKDLRHVKTGSTLMFGSVTDCYQPLESKYQITRSILEQIVAAPEKPFHVSILTKSDLVIRDIDLLKKIPNVSVGFSIAWSNENARKIFDPYCSPIHNRITALQTLREAGIPTFAFIGPILPGITDLTGIFSALEGKAEFVYGETLNLRCGNLSEICRSVEQYDKNLLPSFETNIRDRQYWLLVQGEFLQLAKKYKIAVRGFYCHTV